MANAPEQPSRPVSARVPVPPDMIYSGQLPVEPPATAPSKLSESAWRNAAVTMATILVLSTGGVFIFWPKGNVAGGPVAQASESSTAVATSVATSSATVAPTSAPTSGSPPTQGGASPSGVPMPTGNIPGWKQTFADDFTSGNLEDRWYNYNGQPGGDPGGWFLPSHVTQTNGQLVIAGSRENTPNGNIYATGGVSSSKTFTQTYGRFEYRFRMDKAYGINYVMLLWPASDVWPPEINVAEDDGLSRDLITATLHYGVKDTTITRKSKGAADFTKWHTAGVEWKPGSLTFKLDGKVWTTISSPNVPNIPMSMAMQSQAWPCGHSFSDCPNSTTPAKVNLEVDWVVAYAAA
jgi:beta-glucanase (GH16 family)